MKQPDLLKPFLFFPDPFASATTSYGAPPFLTPSSLKGLLKLPPPVGFTTAALLGAGTIGAFLLLRHLTPSSFSGFSSVLQPSHPAECSSEPHQLSIPGLLNDGNSCFLNSILQAFASSGALLSFVAADGKDRSLSSLQGVEMNFRSMPLAEALTSLLQELSVLDTQMRVASPYHVMHALELYAKHFDLAAQQDAAEALAYLASALHEERSTYFNSVLAFRPSILDAAATFDNDGLCSGIYIEKSNRMERNAFHIWRQHSHLPIEGTMGSLLTCQKCGFQFSTQLESFNVVPLSPPQLADGNIGEGCTIEDCLKRLTMPESISHVICSQCSHASAIHILEMKEKMSKTVVGKMENCTFDEDCSCEVFMAQEGEVWKNCHVDAFKELKFGRCPEVLCLHVQRAVMNRSGDVGKWMGHVSFPFVLNVFPYTLSARRHQKEKYESAVHLQMQLIRHREELQKLLMEKAAFRLQSKDLSFFNNLQLSTDESTSDDTNGSLSSGSEDLASDSSSDSFSRRLGDEMLGNAAQDGHVHPEAYAHSLDVRNVPSSYQSADRGIGFSEGKHSLPSPVANAADGISTCSQGLTSLSDSSLTRKESMMDDSKPSDIASQSYEDQDSVTEHDHCLRMTPSSNSFPPTLLATGMPASPTEDNLCMRRASSRQEEASNDSGRWLYELISVVVHHGSPKNGHYTVYRKAKLPPRNVKNLFSRPAVNAEESQLASGEKHCAQDCSTVLDPSNCCYDGKLEEHSATDKDHADHEPTKKGIMENENIIAQPKSNEAGLQVYFETRHCHPTGLTDTPMENTQEFSNVASVIPDIDMPMENAHKFSDDLSAREDTVLWFRVSDSDVDKVTEEEVLMAQASLLFYERCWKGADANPNRR